MVYRPFIRDAKQAEEEQLLLDVDQRQREQREKEREQREKDAAAAEAKQEAPQVAAAAKPPERKWISEMTDEKRDRELRERQLAVEREKEKVAEKERKEKEAIERARESRNSACEWCCCSFDAIAADLDLFHCSHCWRDRFDGPDLCCGLRPRPRHHLLDP